MRDCVTFRRWSWVIGDYVAGIALLVVFVWFFADERLRQIVERNVNKSLDGYTVQIHGLKFHPLGFSLDLIDLTIVQNANPDPPVASLPKLSAGVDWHSLLRGRLVANFLIDRPTLHIDLKQAKTEIKDKVSFHERGWQDSLEKIYPLKVNQFRVRDANITYVDAGEFKPLRLRRLNLRAQNIRNIHSRERVYPSDISLESEVFDSGRLVIDGHADFLAKPHPGIEGKLALFNVKLDYFKPILRRYHVVVRDGVLSTDGKFEYASETKSVDLKHITIHGVQIDYVHSAQTAAAEKAVAADIARTAKRVGNDPQVLLRVDKINILKSTLAILNSEGELGYRIVFANTDLQMENLSSRRAEGKAVGKVSGKFMGSGNTTANFTFQPKAKSPDLDLKLSIENTELTTMNDLLLAYGSFDVVSGYFSFYSELAVRNGELVGYIKPLFRKMDIYDARQESKKPFFTKIREGAVAALAWALQNRQREEVGAKVTISGELDNPRYSSWEAVFGMLKNAFIKSIAPGLENNNEADRRA